MQPSQLDQGLLAPLQLEGHADGPLSGLDVVVKDVFDLAGTVTGYGNPDWARLHSAASSDAAVVARLREAGARVVGKAKTVEFTYGLEGSNHWYGTPLNPAAADRLPGGSSCGSASAVGAGLAAVGLGSDTGGSVRIPASYCGLFGIRPSWGSISLQGGVPYVPSLDTPGWLCRDVGTLRRVGQALLPWGPPVDGPLLLLREAWDNARPEVAAALDATCLQLARAGWTLQEARLAPQGLESLREMFATIHGREAWQSLGPWIEEFAPTMAETTAERFRIASQVGVAAARSARVARQDFRARMHGLLATGGVLVFPTSPCVAPLLTADAAELGRVRLQTQRVTAIAGLAGLPEISLPLARVDGLPVGLSLVAASGRDLGLLELADSLCQALGLPGGAAAAPGAG